MRSSCLGLVLAFLGLAMSARAQLVDMEKDRVPVTELNVLWRFHTGDDPAWAAAKFDDAGWPLLRADKGWSEQGYKDYAGFAWYRLRVNPPSRHGDLALYVPYISNSYQVFANGQLIGQVGGMPPDEKVVVATHVLFPIPSSAVARGDPLVLALRVWHWPRMDMYSGVGMTAPPRIGDAAALAEWRSLQTREKWWAMSDTELALIGNLLTALAGLALFALRRREREYLWFGSAQLLWALQGTVYLDEIFQPLPYRAAEIAVVCSMAGAQFLNLEFFIALMGQRRRFLYWTATAPLVFTVLSLIPIELGWMPEAKLFLARTICQLVYGVCVPSLLYRGVRAGNREARLLLLPFTLSFGCNVVGGAISLPALADIPWVQAFAMHFYQVVTWPFSISAMNLAGILAMFSVAVVLVLRFVRSREDEERLASELAAARAVQHVLIPDEIPAVPGYQLECVYKPAGEVGGDFFQILPLVDGGALVAIGDVSGKGMPAAMTVSLLVGMLRATAEATTSPGALLGAMNRLMMGRMAGGFTTCLILNVHPNGAVTAANAGHIAPYMNGKELRVENGLPLGLEVAATYSESILELGLDEEITLMTDGVVEARNAAGELFGFDRAAEMVGISAAEIAGAAEAFGQEDDITVLRLTRRAASEAACRAAEPATWSPAPA